MSEAQLRPRVGGPAENLAGDILPYVSPVTVNFDAAYSFPTAWGMKASLDLQCSYHCRIYFNEFNDKTNSQGDLGLLNLSGSIGPAEGPWKLFGYAHNLGNETYQTGSTIYSGLLGATKAVSYGPPRQFGVGRWGWLPYSRL